MPHLFSKTCLLFLVLFSITSQLALAQDLPSPVSKDELLFQKGFLLQELAVEGLGLNETIRNKETDEIRAGYATEIKENLLDDAFKYYEELIDSFPKSHRFYKALINQGFIKLELQDTVEAEKVLLMVLGTKPTDKEKKKVQTEPVVDPNSGYKNDAAQMLAEISLANHEYQRALGFLEEEKKHPHLGDRCILQSERNYTEEMYAKCYMELKKYQKVYDVLLPILFETDCDELLYEALLKTYKKEDLIKKYELAFKSCTIDKSKASYFMIFLNRKIDLMPLLQEASLIEDPAYPGNSIDKLCKNSWLYIRLQLTGEDKKP